MKSYKVAFVGCGNISRLWFAGCENYDRIEICALVDLNLENAKRCAEKYSLSEAYITNSLADAIQVCQPDAVFDVTVPGAHKSVTLEAFEHGLPVLGEKPISDCFEDACEMVNAAKEADLLYAVIQNFRYNGATRAVREALESGVIGDLHTVNCDFYVGIHHPSENFRSTMEHVLILDMAVHTFDAARYIAQADAEEVFCYEHNPKGSWFEHGASATAIFKMTNGITYNYRGSWVGEGNPTTWPSHWRLIGTKGTILWDGKDEIKVEAVSLEDAGFIREAKEVSVEIPDYEPERVAHGGVIRDFVEALDTGVKPLTYCEDNIKSLAMVFGAIESAEKKQMISIPTLS